MVSLKTNNVKLYLFFAIDINIRMSEKSQNVFCLSRSASSNERSDLVFLLRSTIRLYELWRCVLKPIDMI